MKANRRAALVAVLVLLASVLVALQVPVVRGQASELFVGRPCGGVLAWGTVCGNAIDGNPYTYAEGQQGGVQFTSNSGSAYQLQTVMIEQGTTEYAREISIYGKDLTTGSWDLLYQTTSAQPGENNFTLPGYFEGYQEWRLDGQSRVSASRWHEVRGYGVAYVPPASRTSAAATSAAQTSVAQHGILASTQTAQAGASATAYAGHDGATATAEAIASNTALSVATYQALGGTPCGWGAYPPCHVYWETPGPVYVTGTVTISGSVSINNWPATQTPHPAQETAVAVARMGVGGGTNVGASGGGSTEYGNMNLKWLKLNKWDMGCPIDLKDWNTKICIVYDEVEALRFGTFDMPVLPMGVITLSCLVLQMVRKR